MKRLLLTLLAASVVVGCAGNSSADQTTEEPGGSPQFSAGKVEIGGFEMTLDPEVWKEESRNSGKLILQYQPEGTSCEKPSDCSRLTLARDVDGQDGAYYYANVDGEFATIVQCNGGIWQMGGAVEQAAVQVDGDAFKHFINDPCADLFQDEGAPSQPQSFVWHSEERKIVLRFDEIAAGVRLEQTGLEAALGEATLSERW
jgi:hypothetical protein